MLAQVPIIRTYNIVRCFANGLFSPMIRSVVAFQIGSDLALEGKFLYVLYLSLANLYIEDAGLVLLYIQR
jgi:hypothetical protein